MQLASAEISAPPSIAPLLAPRDIARILGCSVRLFERMRSAQKAPQPDIFLGRLPRWKISTISDWIDRGGPSA
jgi:predicted DNA-binding transcriptional regulator AlpA